MERSTMLKLVSLLTLVVVMMGLVACTTPAPQGAGSSGTAGLDNTAWQLTEFGDGRTPSAEAPAPTLAFSAGQATGNSSVNGYGGSYTAGADGSLEFGPLAGTLMAGSDTLNAQERDFLDALDQTVTYQVEGTTLRLLDGEGNVLLTFASLIQ